MKKVKILKLSPDSRNLQKLLALKMVKLLKIKGRGFLQRDSNLFCVTRCENSQVQIAVVSK